MTALDSRHRMAEWLGVAMVGLVSLITAPALLHAQSPPDAGVLQQQRLQEIEQERLDRVPSQAPELTPTPSPSEPSPGEPTIWVSGYEFQGNTLIPTETLQTVVAPYANRQADLTLLREAASAVADYYRDAGWLVRTYLPEQDVSQGDVRITVVEALVGEVALEGTPPTRVDPKHVLGPVKQQLASDAPLRIRALDRGLLLADDLAGVRVSGVLEAGAKPGYTNVRVTAGDDPLLRGDLTVNNGGQRATGTIQGLASLRVESPFKRGDRLSLMGLFSEGTRYGRLGYMRPVGYSGWQVGASVSYLSYELVAKEFEALNASGNAQMFGLEAMYPLIRARNYNVQWLLNYDYRRFANDAGNTRQSNYHINEGTMGLAGNWFEDLLGTPGATFGSVSVVAGSVDQGAHQVGENPAVAGTFSKMRWYLSRQQQLVPWLSVFGSFMGQKGFNTMDSAEKFYIGGPQSVRAYPVNEASGSTGWIGTAELRGHLPWGFGLTGFFDTGRVDNPANIGPSYNLKGGGLTLSWRSPLGLAVDATWAHRLDANPHPTAAGKDQDGSLIRDRFWFAVSYAF